MGLDMYAHKIVDGERIEIAYWRKHSRLHGWMNDLYDRKGGRDEFNCEDVEITRDDLIQLEIAVSMFALPKTEGFFFGGDYSAKEYVEYYKADDVKFINEARKVLNSGGRVVYNAWW